MRDACRILSHSKRTKWWRSICATGRHFCPRCCICSSFTSRTPSTISKISAGRQQLIKRTKSGFDHLRAQDCKPHSAFFSISLRLHVDKGTNRPTNLFSAFNSNNNNTHNNKSNLEPLESVPCAPTEDPPSTAPVLCASLQNCSRTTNTYVF